jgi:hypothetical protein
LLLVVGCCCALVVVEHWLLREGGAMAIRSGLERFPSGGLIVLSLVGLLSTAGGCSWLFTQPLPNEYYWYDIPPCSTNRAPPVLDTLFALTNTASAIYVAGQDNVTNKDTAVALGLSVAALWTLSAVYGYRHTSECEDAHEGRRGGSLPTWRSPPAGTRRYPPPAPRPAEAAAPGQPDLNPAAAPAPPATAPSAPAPQQQDEDDPELRRPAPPRPKPRPIEPRPDAPRFGG